MRFLRFALILMLVLILFSGAAIWIGQRKPLPESLAILHMDMCAAPCWIAIMPSATRWVDAPAKIKAVYPNAEIIADAYDTEGGPVQRIVFNLVPGDLSSPQAAVLGRNDTVILILLHFIDTSRKGPIRLLELAPSALELAAEISSSAQIWDMQGYCKLSIAPIGFFELWGFYRHQSISLHWRTSELVLSSIARDDYGQSRTWEMCIEP